MKVIAHRGNLLGPNKETENTIEAIDDCVGRGYDVEIDVYVSQGKIWIGHDTHKHEISLDYLLGKTDKLWVHAKNILAVELLTKTDLNWFWHDRDLMTITSKGIIWCHYAFIKDGITILHTAREIDHLKPKVNGLLPDIGGICTDYPTLARLIIDENIRSNNNSQCIRKRLPNS